MIVYLLAGLWACALLVLLAAAVVVLAWWLDLVAAVIADLMKGSHR